jgi:hypothetical protein
MPSRFYGVLAFSTPLIAIAPERCELSELTRHYDAGLVSLPGDSKGLAAFIEDLADREGELGEMGPRARRLAEDLYDRKTPTAQFAEAL